MAVAGDLCERPGYDIEANFGGVNEPSAAPGAVRRHLGATVRSAMRCTESFRNVPGHGALHERRAHAVRCRPFNAFSGFGQNHQTLGKMTPTPCSSWQQALVEGRTSMPATPGCHRWTEDGANTATGGQPGYRMRYRCSGTTDHTFAPRIVAASGVWEHSGTATAARRYLSVAGRLHSSLQEAAMDTCGVERVVTDASRSEEEGRRLIYGAKPASVSAARRGSARSSGLRA